VITIVLKTSMAANLLYQALQDDLGQLLLKMLPPSRRTVMQVRAW